ncbi:MAG: cation transporter [Clostridia bacterium]|nr:cation transporter [Clostridia bacterium]
MERLLGKLFIKDFENYGNPIVRRAWGTVVSVFGIVMNLLLFAGKFIVGTLTGSISIRADAVNNLSDAAASIVTLISFKISAKPADRAHPFGHARIEYVASMIVSFFILFIGVDLVRDAFGKLFTPVVPVFRLVAVIVLSVSVLCKLLMAFLNRRVGKHIDSDVMRATAADSFSDAAATSAVLVANLLGLILPDAASQYVDPIMGILVAGLVFVAGLRVLNDTKNSILGEAPTEETVAAIRRIVGEYPAALGIHDLVVHNYGPGKTLASLHVEVDGKADMFYSHDVIDLIERRLAEEEHIIATIHMDPIITDDPKVDEWRERIIQMVQAFDKRLQIHDFRMVPGLTHTNLIFDIAAPFELKMSDDELIRAVSSVIHAVNGKHFAVITIDRV